MNQIQQLESRKSQIRASIHQLRGDIARQERAIGGEHTLGGLRDAVRTREAELERVEFALHRARQPQPVQIPVTMLPSETHERYLRRARAEITIKRDIRHRQHAEHVEHVMAPYAVAPEEHRKIHYRNNFGSSEAARREVDQADARVLAEIDRQLAALDEPEAVAS